MSKVVSFSFTDYVYDTYISGVYNNRSKYVEELIVLGAEAKIGSQDNVKKNYIELLKRYKELEEDCNRLKFELAKITSKSKKSNNPSLEKKKMMARTVKAAGVSSVINGE